ncbi:hypothetical protein MLD38_026561 [Melastoma candidum]|uniref:Uncharacterized protein n=1 Tax=Melastoma candidum TaxID=119954 RepID=A0ACB9NYZ3_9MYRT|nr:hypothetical protein MLD38_026561 [Melastoma candidum]
MTILGIGRDQPSPTASARGNTGPLIAPHRRARSISLSHASSMPPPADDVLDLFSRSRRSISRASSDDPSSDAPPLRLGRLSVGSAKLSLAGIDDPLFSAEGGKHDYDWLLTPPGTPLVPSSDGTASQPTRVSSGARSTSAAKSSRLSVSQSEVNHSLRPIRSSSATRSSISTSHYNNYSSNRLASSILNTSSASVSSYIRPSSPAIRSSSSTRLSTPSACGTLSHSSTPSRVHPTTTGSSTEKPRPSVSSRPSTPSSRPHISTSVSSPAAPRQSSRPSTPTRRSSTSSLSPSSSSSTATSRGNQNGRTSAPTSRPSSPTLRLRPPPQPIVPADFPLETPPNLRKTLPDHPLSAGRSRHGTANTVKGNHDALTPTSIARRQSLPVVTRGRLSSAEPNGKARGNANGPDATEHRKSPSPELGMRNPVKSMTSLVDRGGLGRTISKNSLDMAIRHLDIRNGTGSMRALSSTALFPQSIRSSASKTQSICAAGALKKDDLGNNPLVIENGFRTRAADNRVEPSKGRHSVKLTDIDMYESSRYDAILLREDLKNSNWLHSFDEKSDDGPIFENGLEYLPEPFHPL